MAWDKTYSVNGKSFGLFGWGRDVSLQFNKEQIQAAGNDLQTIINWYVENCDEVGIVEFWRETNYDPQFFGEDELEMISNSGFINDDERKYIYHPELRRQTQYKYTPKSKKDTGGYVYLLRSNGVYKIGKTKVLDNRISQISPVLPHPVEVVHTIKCSDRTATEMMLHARYDDKRLNGEWFALTEEDVMYIRNLQ